ncbi:MAG TPA: hypothetical protein VFK90_17875 [Anaeromyxobacter sp.]|nr:hypothetical protein [Anaeromyxobacter sp.]
MRKLALMLSLLSLAACSPTAERIITQPECTMERDGAGQCWACCQGYQDARSECPVLIPAPAGHPVPPVTPVPPGQQVP